MTKWKSINLNSPHRLFKEAKVEKATSEKIRMMRVFTRSLYLGWNNYVINSKFRENKLSSLELTLKAKTLKSLRKLDHSPFMKALSQAF